MNEVLDLLFEDEGENDVFIEPPDVRDLTDEDSGDENLDGILRDDNLLAQQLHAPAEWIPCNRNTLYDPQGHRDIQSLSSTNIRRKRQKVVK
uniref:Uncharacterized protein n=1 Tax=Lepeophtheirus salmonis TaxID=72036 RepID=A0A0K2U9E6_LEPSM